MSSHRQITVRPFGPADQSRLKTLADAVKATGIVPRTYDLRGADQGEILILLAEDEERVVGALTVLRGPGGMALVLSPLSIHPHAPDASAIESALLHAAANHLRTAGAKAAYAVLPVNSGKEGASLERSNYQPITELIYYQAFTAELTHAVGLGDLRLIPFREQPRAFTAALVRSYEGTLDCPELDGLRTVEEVLTGHAAVGSSGTSLWRLIMSQENPVGVLLRAEIAEEATLDLVYLGLIPSARRQGLGRRLMCHLMSEAQSEGWSRVTLAADSRNLPALRLYESVGFTAYDRRRFYLQNLNSRAAAAPLS